MPYSSERLQLHRDIVQSALKEKESSDFPLSIVLGGGMFTGKTGIKKVLLGEAFEHEPERGIGYPSLSRKQTVVIDPHIFDVVPEFQRYKHMQHPEKLPHFINEYYDLCEEIIEVAVDRGYSVLICDHADQPERVKGLFAYGSQHQSMLIGAVMDPVKHLVISDDLEKRNLGREIDHQKAISWLLDFQRNWETLRQYPSRSILFDTTQKITPFYREDEHGVSILNEEVHRKFIQMNADFAREVLNSEFLIQIIRKRDVAGIYHSQIETSGFNSEIPTDPQAEHIQDIWSLLPTPLFQWLYLESLRQRVQYTKR